MFSRSTTIIYTYTSSSDFSLSASPTSITTNPVNPETSMITASTINGFNGMIDLLASTGSSSWTCTPNPNSIAPSQSSTLSCSGSAGTYTVTITGTSGSLTHTTTVTYTVLDFSITANPSSVTAFAGPYGESSTITIAALNGFTGDIQLAITAIQPMGLSCSPLSQTTFTLTPTTTGGMSTLSCSGSAGLYMVTMIATSSGCMCQAPSHTLMVTFNVVLQMLESHPQAYSYKTV